LILIIGYRKVCIYLCFSASKRVIIIIYIALQVKMSSIDLLNTYYTQSAYDAKRHVKMRPCINETYQDKCVINL